MQRYSKEFEDEKKTWILFSRIEDKRKEDIDKKRNWVKFRELSLKHTSSHQCRELNQAVAATL